MEKRMFVALILSLVVIFFFQFYLKGNQKINTPYSTATEQQEAPVTQEVITAPDHGSDREDAPEEQTHIVETQKYEIVFSDIGGVIKKIYLKSLSNIQE